MFPNFALLRSSGKYSEYILLGSLHWANLFLQNNKPTNSVSNSYFYSLRDQERTASFQNCSDTGRGNTVCPKQCQFKTVIKTELSNLCSKLQITIFLRRKSAAARLVGLQIRIPPREWLLVFSQCCVFSCTGLCDGPIPLPERS